MLQWVCFDVGETLMDEQDFWDRWADWLDVPRDTFRAELSAVIGAGQHHRAVFERFRPGLDVAGATAERRAAGDEPGFRPDDLFADVRPCFAALRRRGLKIGIVGNNPLATEEAIARCGLGPDLVASSARWGTKKPAAAFYGRLAAECAAPPAAIAYVGDRLDNDALPAVAAGMTGIWLRRGLWAEAQRDWPEASRASAVIDDLDALAPALAGLGA